MWDAARYNGVVFASVQLPIHQIEHGMFRPVWQQQSSSGAIVLAASSSGTFSSFLSQSAITRTSAGSTVASAAAAHATAAHATAAHAHAVLFRAPLAVLRFASVLLHPLYHPLPLTGNSFLSCVLMGSFSYAQCSLVRHRTARSQSVSLGGPLIMYPTA